MSKQSSIQIHRPIGLLRAETVIAYLLRGGVSLAGSIITTGLLLRFLRPEATEKDNLHLVLSSGTSETLVGPRSLESFLSLVKQLDPNAIISLGIIVLILLPVFRVAM